MFGKPNMLQRRRFRKSERTAVRQTEPRHLLPERCPRDASRPAALPIWPPVSSSARSIWRRSAASLTSASGTKPAPSALDCSGKRSPGMIHSLVESATARSTRFRSSRTFPGHEWASAASSASALNPRMRVSDRLTAFSRNRSRSQAMSSGRSPQRRDLDRQHGQPEIEVLPESGRAAANWPGRDAWPRRSRARKGRASRRRLG